MPTPPRMPRRSVVLGTAAGVVAAATTALTSVAASARARGGGYRPTPGSTRDDIGRPMTPSDMRVLGWDGIQEPRVGATTVLESGEAPGGGGPGGLIMRTELRAGELTSSGGTPAPRTEVYGRRPVPWSTPALLWPDPENSTRWYQFSLYVPLDFPVATDTRWLDLTQWKGRDGGTPPIALEIKRSNLRLGGARTNSGLIPNGGTLGPIFFGSWTTITVGLHFATDPRDGWVQVYRDGLEVVTRTSVSTMDTINGQVDPVYLKQGIYRSAVWDVTQVLYFSPMTITEEQPAVP